LLKAHRDRSTGTRDDDLVFPNRDGKPLREYKVLERVLLSFNRRRNARDSDE
jgi:hypothetical protein